VTDSVLDDDVVSIRRDRHASSTSDGDEGFTRTARGARTRANLLTAARGVFAAQGFVASRVEDIVAAAGVSHGTFYTYFANKSAVLDALIDDTASELLAVVEEPWDGPDVQATIHTVIGRFVDVFAMHADVVRTWFEASAHDRDFLQRLRMVRAEYVERVAFAVAPVVAGSRHDATHAAGALVAMVEGYASHGLSGDDDDARAAAAETLTALWFGGLRQLADGN